MREYLLVLLVATAATYLFAAVCRQLALRWNAVAKVRARDVHTSPKPYFGGLAMFGGLVVCLILAVNMPFLSRFATVGHDALVVLLASGLICAVGLVDDVVELSPVVKFGGQVLDTMSIENYISVLETDGPKFAAALEAHTRHYGVDIMNLQKVESISRDEAAGMVTVKTASGASLKSKTVILATGARWRSMVVPGEQEYRNRGVTYCPHCDGPLFKGKRVAVIGGGNSGVEAAIDLAGVVDHVTLFEFMPELRADAVLQRKLESLPNVKILKNVQVTEVKASNDKVSAIVYKDRTNDSIHEVALEGVFVQIGLVPNTDFLKDSGITLVRNGEIQVDVRGQTSMEGVFAAGDCTTSPYKQIIIAAGDGAKAALAAFDHLIRTSAPK